MKESIFKEFEEDSLLHAPNIVEFYMKFDKDCEFIVAYRAAMN